MDLPFYLSNGGGTPSDSAMVHMNIGALTYITDQLKTATFLLDFRTPQTKNTGMKAKWISFLESYTRF